MKEAGTVKNAKSVRDLEATLEKQKREATLEKQKNSTLSHSEFESGVEGAHTVDTAQSQLLHEGACGFCAFDAEQLARCVGLSSGEHSTHCVNDMQMQRSCR